MAGNSWKRVKQNLIYKNRFGYEVYDDDVLTPNGSAGKYLYLTHPGYVFVVALTPDRKVAMVRQWRYPSDCEFFELPAGGIEKDEDPLTAAKRELQEETGAKSTKWIKLADHLLANGVANIRGHLYLALDITLGKNNFDPTEKMQLEFPSFDEIVGKVVAGEIDDERTQLGILFADKYLSKTTASRSAVPKGPKSGRH